MSEIGIDALCRLNVQIVRRPPRSNLFMVVSAFSPEDEVERQSLNTHTSDQPIRRCTRALTFEEDIIYEDGIVRR